MLKHFVMFLALIITCISCKNEQKRLDVHANKEAGEYFKIEKENSDLPFIQVFVYVSDTSKIAQVNRYLSGIYIKKDKPLLDIVYSDKENYYKQMVDSSFWQGANAASTVEANKHLIAVYEKLRGKEGRLTYSHWQK